MTLPRRGDYRSELPSEAEIRPTVNASPMPTRDIAAAKRVTERPAETDIGFRDRLTDTLSDRRETVLRRLPQRLLEGIAAHGRGASRLAGRLCRRRCTITSERTAEGLDRVVRRRPAYLESRPTMKNLVSCHVARPPVYMAAVNIDDRPCQMKMFNSKHG